MFRIVFRILFRVFKPFFVSISNIFGGNSVLQTCRPNQLPFVQRRAPSSTHGKIFKVPEGHHPRGKTLREALRGNLPLRGLCGLSEGFAGSLRGFCGVSAGFWGGLRDFPRCFGGSDPTCDLRELLEKFGNSDTPAVVFRTPLVSYSSKQFEP